MQPSEIERRYQTLAGSDPRAALEQFDATMAQLDAAGGSNVEQARLLRQAALAARSMRDLDRSNALAAQGIDRATAAGDHNTETMLNLTVAYNHFLAGDADAAISLVSILDGRGDHLLAATIDFQRATILGRLGRLEEAIAALEEANAIAHPTGDRSLELHILKNLGMLRARRGDCDTAAVDTEAARQIALEEELDFEAAFCEHNLGLIASHAGDMPTAFAHFERAERRILELSGSDFESKAGHCRALLSAGLFQEAAAMAGEAADRCDEADFRADGADSRILEAGALLELGRYDAARDRAHQARSVFASHDRLGMGAVADLMLATIDHRRGEPVDRTAVRAVIERLRETSMRREALLARLLLIELLSGGDEREAARHEFDAVAPALGGVSADVQLAGSTTEAVLLAAEGDRAGADEAAIRGFELLIEQQSLMGSADLRVALRQHARDLGRLGLGLAVEGGDGRKVLAWSERSLLTASTPRPVRPPDDPSLRRAIARLRSIEGDDGTELAAREEEVRTLARTQQAAGWQGGGLGGSVDVDALVESLGQRAGISIATHDDDLVLSAIIDGAVHHRVIGGGSKLLSRLRSLRSDLRRRATVPRLARPERILAQLQQLDDALLVPLDLGDRELVIAPGVGLSAVPWASLASRVGRLTTTATSLTAWAATATQTAAAAATMPGAVAGAADPGRVVALVAGAEVAHSGDELDAVADAAGPGAAIARAGTTTEALAAMDGASMAHVVAHGTTRVDNPLFSNLRLADGELSVYELGDLERPPDLVILSACHVGLPAERPGQELLGMVTGLLSAGTSCVIASTLPVPDDRSTIDLMTRLHHHLADGMGPTAAWAQVQRTCADTDQLLDTASFTVFGRG